MQLKKISRRAFLIGGLSLIPYTYFETTSVAVRKYTVQINNLPPEFKGFTILHLTDLHSKMYGENQQDLLRLINRHRFDLTVITGDLVDGNNPDSEPALALIKDLSKPVYFVPGNHDWWTGYHIKKPLLFNGVRFLENSSGRLTRGGSHIWLTGVDDPFTGRARLDEALSSVTDAMPKVLLAHSPVIYPEATAKKADLILAGHTHGGQIRLPLLGALNVPGQGWFPQLDYGLFTSGKTNMIINSGLGESFIPFRFNCRPEIVLVTLDTKE